MQIIRDIATIRSLQEQYPTDLFFSAEFKRYHYCLFQKNEYLQTPDEPNADYYIVLSGSVQLFTLSPDGNKTPICSISEMGCIGIVELCYRSTPAYAMANTDTICLVLSMEDCRGTLKEDLSFLRFNLEIFAQQLSFTSYLNFASSETADRLLFYLRSKPDHRISSVEDTTYALRCSRSSLQRALAQLLDSGAIKKVGKGAYQLSKTE